MDMIASKTLDEFVEMLEPKENPEDMSPAQLLGQMIIGETQLYQLEIEKMKKNSYKYTSCQNTNGKNTKDGDKDDDTPISQETKDLFVELCESEQQRNPLTYDIALAFRRDLSKDDALLKLARYETTHRRAFHAAVQELHRLQDRRRQKEASQPSIIEVDEGDHDG